VFRFLKPRKVARTFFVFFPIFWVFFSVFFSFCHKFASPFILFRVLFFSPVQVLKLRARIFFTLIRSKNISEEDKGLDNEKKKRKKNQKNAKNLKKPAGGPKG